MKYLIFLTLCFTIFGCAANKPIHTKTMDEQLGDYGFSSFKFLSSGNKVGTLLMLRPNEQLGQNIPHVLAISGRYFPNQDVPENTFEGRMFNLKRKSKFNINAEASIVEIPVGIKGHFKDATSVEVEIGPLKHDILEEIPIQHWLQKQENIELLKKLMNRKSAYIITEVISTNQLKLKFLDSTNAAISANTAYEKLKGSASVSYDLEDEYTLVVNSGPKLGLGYKCLRIVEIEPQLSSQKISYRAESVDMAGYLLEKP